jgi:uncharacterized protein with beta-barrel porin domain
MRFDRAQWWMHGAASAALTFGLSVSMATLAQAACTPAAVDAATPAPGTTVSCTGATVEDLTAGYGTGNQTGITIDIGAGASVQSNTSLGIWVGDAAIRNGPGASVLGSTDGIIASTGALAVTNDGSITATDGNAINAATGVTLTNHAGASISGGASGVVSTAGAITVDNAGSITARGSAASDAAIAASADIMVINRAGGVISGGTSGISSLVGNINIDNAGSITNTGGLGLAAVNADAGSVTMINRASGSIGGVNAVNISVTNFGSVGAVSASGGLQLVNNAGAIINGPYAGVTVGAAATTSSISNAGVISGSFAYGVMVDNSGTTVNNLAGGSIIGGVAGVFASSDLSLTNSGTISGGPTMPGLGVGAGGVLHLVNNAGASISGSGAGIATGVDGSSGSSIFNAGSISGSMYGILALGSTSIVNSGSISSDTAAIQFMVGGNTLTLLPGSVISGRVIGFGSDTLQLGGIGAANFDVSQLGADPTLQYSGFNTFNKIDSSIWTLTGTTTYAGPVNVNGGTLAVNGNLASASLLTVNSGGTIGGTGTLGATIINGGTLAPGNSIGTLTIASLTMTAASTYLVQISGAASDRTIITGTAAIAGKVVVDPLARLTSTTTYTIINAGTLTGTFDSASVTGNFARNARLSYAGNNVFLTLDPGLLSPILPGNASINNRNVAAGIDNALEGATLPASFNGLFLLGGNNLLYALTQISGETTTGSQQTTFDAMTQFMGLLSDPFTAGRGGAVPAPFAFSEDDALAYAPGGRKRTRTEREAYAMFTKAPPRAYEARWNVWAAGFGGSRTTDGNATLGSNRTTGSIAGGAVGADYWFSPETVAGFALAGGGTSFSVAGGGSGQSDLFQAGAFVRHSIASSYITATAAYGWQDISTDRMVTAVGAERLRANFNANAYSGRLEAGNRWLVPELGGVGLTPYAAVQVTAFELPAYSETSANGAGGFALDYAGKTVTATRTELGLRGDKSWGLAEGLLTLRGRAAWAHDYTTDRNVSAVFQSLPGSAFTVNGASAAGNTALTSASAEMSFTGGWSVAATFDGEFSDISRSYAGKGVVRYAW